MRVPQQLDGATRPLLPRGGARRACLSTPVWKAARGQTSFTRGSPHGATTPLPPLPAPQHTVGTLRCRRRRRPNRHHSLLLLLLYLPEPRSGPPPMPHGCSGCPSPHLVCLACVLRGLLASAIHLIQVNFPLVFPASESCPS